LIISFKLVIKLFTSIIWEIKCWVSAKRNL